MPVRHRAAAVIVHDSRLLMVHEHDTHEVWTLPGGGIEPGESAEDAVRREVSEETGLRAVSARFLFDAPYPSGPTSVFAVSVVDPAAALAADARWVPLPDVDPDGPGHPVPLLIVAVPVRP